MPGVPPNVASTNSKGFSDKARQIVIELIAVVQARQERLEIRLAPSDTSGIARGDGGAAAPKKDSHTKGHFQ